MDALELQEHAEQLSLFLSAWTVKQEQLVQNILALSNNACASEERYPLKPICAHLPDLRSLDSARADRSSEWNTIPQMQGNGSTSAASCLEPVSEPLSEPLTPLAVEPSSVALPSLETPSMEQPSSLLACSISPVSSPSPTYMRSSGSMQSLSLQNARGKSRFSLTNIFKKERLISKVLSFVSSTVIMFNSLVIAAASDYAMANPIAPNSSMMLSSCELACAIYYIIELALQLYLQGKLFWTGWDWKWNMFDLCLALQAIMEQVERYVISDLDSISNLSFVRMLRLLRTLKLLRVIRILRTFRELRLLLSSLFGCVQSFIWACVLVVAICFMVGISIMQSCSHYVADNDGGGNHLDALRDIDKLWSSVATSMLTLIMASTGGRDWAEVALPLKVVGWPPYAMFIFYIAVFHFVLLNIVNSIFIETMMTHAARDGQFVIQTMLEKKRDCIEKIQALYDEMDENGDGEISFEEFCTHAERPELCAFCSSMDMDVSDAKYFFRVLSAGGKRQVDLPSFVDGCIKMKGMARSMDLIDLLNQHKAAVRQQRKFFNETREQIQHIGILLSGNGSTTHAVIRDGKMSL